MFNILKRWLFIWSVIATYRLDKALSNAHTHVVIRLLLWLTPASRKADLSVNKFERIRLALECMGPIFIKFGQALSTRPDLLPPDLAKELSKLQDKVKPFPTEQSIALIESALNTSIDQAFLSFDEDVLGSASIAQVHTAKLKTGEDVVVKVVRPGIDAVIEGDLQTMRLLTKMIDFMFRDLRRARLPEMVEEFAHTLYEELDLRQETANASQLKAHFTDSALLYVPKVYWDFVSKNVMVMERLSSTPMSDIQTLKDKHVDMEKLASLGIEIFFTQVFHHKFFHADMHPGNIFVDISDPQNPKYESIDFGIMGTLSAEDQYYLAANFLALMDRDYFRIAKLHIDSGWVPSYVNINAFEAAIRKVGEPIFGRPLNEIRFGEMLISLIQVAQRFDMIIQPQLMLLQKTVLNVEGLGRVLYPKLDIWAVAKPILITWMKNNFGRKAMAKQIKMNAIAYRDLLPKIPQLIDQQLARTNKPEPKLDKTPRAVVFGATLIICVMPNVWHEEITRPIAIVSMMILAFQLWRGRKT